MAQNLVEYVNIDKSPKDMVKDIEKLEVLICLHLQPGMRDHYLWRVPKHEICILSTVIRATFQPPGATFGMKTQSWLQIQNKDENSYGYEFKI